MNRRGFEFRRNEEEQLQAHEHLDLARQHSLLEVKKGDPLPESTQKLLKNYLADHHGYRPEEFRNENGQIYVYNGERGKVKFSAEELKKAEPLKYAQLEYNIKKQALYEALSKNPDIPNFTQDINGLKIDNGIYRFSNSDGEQFQISRDGLKKHNQEVYSFSPEEQKLFDESRNKIESQLTSLGSDINSKPVPDTVEKEIKEYAIKNEIGLKEQVENGTIIDYHYDKETDKHKFYIAEREKDTFGSIKDGAMKEVTFDLKTLPSEARTDFEYQVEKHALASTLSISLEDVNQLKKTSGEYEFENRDGTEKKVYLTEDQKKQIENDMSSLGVKNNRQQVSDSIKTAVLENSVKVENDPDLVKAIEHGVVVYYEQFNEKDKKHEFSIIPREKLEETDTELEGKGIKIKDKEAMKISFSSEEYKAMMSDAELKAARKYIKLEDNKKVSERENAVQFDTADKTKYRVQDADGGEHIVLRDGPWKTDIENALGRKQGVPLKQEQDLQTMVDYSGPDSQVSQAKRDLTVTKRWVKGTKFFIEVLAAGDEITLGLSQHAIGAEAAMLQVVQGDQAQVPVRTLTQEGQKALHRALDNRVNLKKKRLEMAQNHENREGAGSREALTSQVIARAKQRILADQGNENKEEAE